MKIITMLLVLISSTAAFSQNIGVVDEDLVLKSMPEYQFEKEILMNFDTAYQTIYDSLANDFNTTYQKYLDIANSGLVTPKQVEVWEENLGNKRNYILDFQKKGKSKRLSLSHELEKQRIQFFKAIVYEIALEKNLNYILDKKKMIDSTSDFTDLVIKKMKEREHELIKRNQSLMKHFAIKYRIK